MPNCSSTLITIGGPVKNRADATRLVDALFEDGAGLNYEGADARELKAELHEAARDGRPASFSANDQPWGRFERAEALCQELGLTYHRADDGHYAYSPENVLWRPGMDRPEEAAGNIEGGPAIRVREIRQWFDGGGSREGFLREYVEPWAPVPPLTLEYEKVTA